MPRYFFDINADGETDPDQEGIELPDLHAARREGGCCAGEMIRCASLTGLPDRWSMNVRDEGGHVLVTLWFGMEQTAAA